VVDVDAVVGAVDHRVAQHQALQLCFEPHIGPATQDVRNWSVRVHGRPCVRTR
jgi:hypothetical protein